MNRCHTVSKKQNVKTRQMEQIRQLVSKMLEGRTTGKATKIRD